MIMKTLTTLRALLKLLSLYLTMLRATESLHVFCRHIIVDLLKYN